MDFYAALKLAKIIAEDTNTILVTISYHLKRSEYTAYIQVVKGYSVHPITLNNHSYGQLIERIESLKAEYTSYAD